MAETDLNVRAVEEALRRTANYTPQQINEAIAKMHPDQIARIGWRTRWVASRHAHQVPPDGPRRGTWLLMGGRGSGKTRVGAEELGFACAMGHAKYRGLISSATSGDIRGTCLEGESGLLNVIPTVLVKKHVRSLNEIHLHNGAYIGGIPASEPERFRGPQWHSAWLDEIAAWSNDGNDAEYAWDIMAMSVRLGKQTWKIASTTPKPEPLIYRMIAESKDPRRHLTITGATTYDNIENLSDDFKAEILKYEGTQIGLQEIYAQVLNPESTGIIKREWIRTWPWDKPLPEFDLVIASLDTAYSEKQYDEKRKKVDPSACSVWGCYREQVTLPSGKKIMEPRIVLLYCWEKYVEFPELIKEIKTLKNMRWGRTDQKAMIKPLVGSAAPGYVGRKIDYIVIEGKASGKSVRQQLAAEGITTLEYNPGKADKLTRLHVVSAIVKKGTVWVVESDRMPNQKPVKFRSWAEPLVQQLCGYSGPATILKDDLLDTTTQALRYINDLWLHFLPPADVKEAERKRVQREVERAQNASNPYAE